MNFAQLHVLFSEITRGISLHLWQDVTFQNARRHGPGWIELDVLHVSRENRAFAVRASNLRPSFPYLLPVSEQLGLEVCDVDGAVNIENEWQDCEAQLP